MIDAAQDHDGKTGPTSHKPQKAIEVLSVERLAELAELAQEHPGRSIAVETETVAELVRLYRSIRSVADSVDRIGQIGDALERQIDVAEEAAQGVLRRAGQRFEILLHWGERQRLFTTVETGWHCTDDGLKWSGSFQEAIEIVRKNYGPKRGTSAFVVVRVDE